MYILLGLTIFLMGKAVVFVYKRSKYFVELAEVELEFYKYYNFMVNYYEKNNTRSRTKYLITIKTGFLRYQKALKNDEGVDEELDFVNMLKTDSYLKDAQDHIKKFGFYFKDEYRESRLDKLLKN